MASYYDDNFGWWEGMEGPDGEDNRRFYKQVQKNSVRKKCKGCEQWVRIQRQYAYCNSCADKIEKGHDF